MPNKSNRTKELENWMRKTAPQRAKDRAAADKRFCDSMPAGYCGVADPQGLNHKPKRSR